LPLIGTLRIPLAILFLIALFPAPALAQDTGASGVGARVLPGVAFQYGVFGDDNPRGRWETGLTLGGQLCMNRSEDRAFVVEGTVPFNWLDSPHGGEWVRAVPVLVGAQRGRDSYFRASIGVAVQFWRRQSVDVAFAGSIGIGRNFGTERWVASEGVLQIVAGPGFVKVSLGAQLPVGKCY
jgi:hypothetical protein